ncbi:MAG: hypothetical protein HN657_04005 [Candidatus Marinimicrobia bacterium]|nr:hypothetical protein [Candidatus Neomarinimicrobiota bacterium]MBT3496759.1 hypothetical protein [Candidatus Neomarinimicrobiota bacterium]MBT3692689.1 hypothetical protein [Candidatus Neomarinimicrobiota bacterium]MBT3732893.1 hypothetical protein [Candidatus Neomarinimicrobiota bacterium]MBT4144768.1 hypothetical protein [Candidatus Neomarinimicrobiota bacterium]
MNRYTTIIIGLISISSILMAQGVGFSNAPTQAPIGGLKLLIGAGGAMAWKKFREKNK